MRRVLASVVCAAAVAIAISIPLPALASGSCSVVSSTAINFGATVIPGRTNVLSLSTVSSTCSAGASYTVAFDHGLNPTGAGLSQRRQLASGSNFIVYDLYSDSARTITWGDGTNVGAAVAGTGTGGSQMSVVYGRIANVPTTTPVGSYADTVTITVTF